MMSAPRLSSSDPADIIRAAALLRQGGVVVIPTDTVYGLAASVLCTAAVQRVFAIKARPANAPVPILLSTAADITLLAQQVPRQGWTLITRFWPGQLTLVLPAKPSVDPSISAGTGKVAVRVPASRACLELLSCCGVPLVGTSANRTGLPAAASAEEAASHFGGDVDAILDDGVRRPAGLPSTVVEVARQGWKIHRQGAVSAEDIADALGPELRRIL